MGYKIDLTNQRFGRWTVLEFDTNKNGQTYWRCKCDCGTERSVPASRLRNGTSKSCGCLAKELKSQRSRKDITGQRFGRLVAINATEKRQGGKVVWLCQCDCGNQVEVAIDRLTTKNIQSCGCLSREKASERFSIDIQGQTYGKLTVIQKDIKTHSNGHIYWLCKCACGNPNLEAIDGVCLRNGSRQHCSLCSPKSKGEEQIKNLLLKNNIPFEQEKTFNDCRFSNTNRLARFDFYINNKYLLEFDGKQHFYDTGGKWQSLSYTQQHDYIKNEYCRKKHIPLIRIPYSKLNFIEIKDLLLETSNYIVE